MAANPGRTPVEAGLDAPASLLHEWNLTTSTVGLQAFAFDAAGVVQRS
jgi:hypothetical protein